MSNEYIIHIYVEGIFDKIYIRKLHKHFFNAFPFSIKSIDGKTNFKKIKNTKSRTGEKKIYVIACFDTDNISKSILR